MASGADNDNFLRMQHLIDEMDRSNQRIDLFSEKFDMDSLRGGTIPKRPSSLEKHFDVLIDDAGRSEESDGASLQEIAANHHSRCLEDSGCEEVINSAIAEVSKDFLSGLQTSGIQNQYGDSDESRISSDTDFKLIGGKPAYARYPETAAGLSDTDWNPYGTESDNNQSPRLHSAQSLAKESKSSSSTPFQPILSSTGLNAVTPNSGDMILSLDTQSHLSNIREITEQESSVGQILKPDITNNQNPFIQKADWAITPKRVIREPSGSIFNQTLRGQELDIQDPFKSDMMKMVKGETSPKESASSDEEKKMIASTSSTGYSSATSGVKTNLDINKEKLLHTQPQYLSVFERAKLMGIPEDILYDKPAKQGTKTHSGGLSDYDSDDHLGQKVHHILSETAYLSGGNERTNYNKAGVDYNLLQKDLQEIQDNLESLSSNSPPEYKQTWKKPNSLSSSDKEGDVSSSPSTPGKTRNTAMWEFAEVIGSLANRIQTDGVSSHRSNVKKLNLNSDGDDTRSSESSKTEDHGVADMGLSEIPDDFQSNLRDLHTSRDVDQMLSTFQDQRLQLESRYQQLSNQGLAEKVFRILTNQDPESQANGILSEVSAEEKEMRAKMILKQHNRDFNFSSNSSYMEDSHRSLGLPDDVRKKLDLSGISSVDSSKLLDKSSFNLPSSSRGFSACDDAKRFLSSQMTKASERTFNHSIEMRYPQSIQCYPLYRDKSKEDEKKHDEDGSSPNTEANENAATGAHNENNSSVQQDKHETPYEESPDFLASEKQESSTGYDSGVASRPPKEKYRPYRPPGSKEVYYTESDTASVADSVTTMESTHAGSDDAAAPNLPTSAYGSRREAPNVAGIYGTRKNLSTVQEGTEPPSTDDKSSSRSSKDEKEYAPTEIKRDEPSTRLKQHDIPTHQDRSNVQSGRAVTTQRYTSSIWAKREDDTSAPSTTKREVVQAEQGNAEFLSNGDPVSPSHSVSAARRNARWANRVEEKSQEFSDFRRNRVERDMLVEQGSSQRPSRFNHRDVLDGSRLERDPTVLQEAFSLPTNAFVSEYQKSPEQEDEPMSLRIKLAYTDTNTAHERSPKRDDIYERYNDKLRSHFSDDDQDFRIPERTHNQSWQRSLYNQNLRRSASDENLNSSVRDARLSPAFRRALSPELMNSIGSRSPLLGRTIERSLAQPASNYPLEPRNNYASSPVELRPHRQSDPPTFLARERSLSPREYVRSPTNERFGMQTSVQSRRSPQTSVQSRKSPLPSPNESRSQRLRTQQISPNRRTHGRQQTPEYKQDDNDDDRRIQFNMRHISPSSLNKRKVELTLEGMSSESEVEAEIDMEPISKRAQLLKDALSHEREPSLNPDINAMWEQFKASNESDDSTINSARMEAVADLLKNPSAHLVSHYLKEREEYRIERQERMERERENKIKEQQMRAQKSSSSEDDFNERYNELLAAKEEERLKRRSAKKKKGKNGESAKTLAVTRGDKKQEDKNADSLYSIPEDRSFEQSPGKASSGPKTKLHVSSQPHLIDPNMLKLREKISCQRNKVNKEMMKEMVKIEKLKKLEQLLKAKRKGEITSQMLERQLEELSSTSVTPSDNSHESIKIGEPNAEHLSDDSTTAKDSSGEMRMWKLRKENQLKAWDISSDWGGKKDAQNNNNKERNPKHDSAYPSKESLHHSEIKLLKLVKEGYLTAEEAYKLALARSGRREKSQLHDDSSEISSENDHSFKANRHHKFYSPYTRSSRYPSQGKHIPKLKSSDNLSTSSLGSEKYWQGGYKPQAWKERHDIVEFNSEKRHGSPHNKFSASQGPQRLSKDVKLVTGNRDYYSERTRPRSQSPLGGRKNRYEGQRNVTSAIHQSSHRPHSVSPSRRSKDVLHVSGKGKHGHISRGKKSSLENEPPVAKKSFGMNKGVAWHIDMSDPPHQWKEPRPLQEVPLSTFNKPLDKECLLSDPEIEMKNTMMRPRKVPKEQQDIWQKSNHPHGIPKLQWEKVISQDALASKANHWAVDPIMDRVEYILNKPSPIILSDQSSSTRGRGDVGCVKSSKFSLQEAFLERKQDFISRCRERQKRLALAKEDRQMQECLRLEREAIFAEQERLGVPNVYAHPYSDNLYQPKRRILTKQEMKELTARKYKNLPEVIEKKDEDRRKIEYKLNRLRANLFNKKVQKEVLKKRFKHRG